MSWLAMTPDDKRRRSKNLALLGVLLVVIALLYALTVIRIGEQL